MKRPSQYAHRGKALLQEAEALNAAVIVLSPRERDFTSNSYQRSMAKCALPRCTAWLMHRSTNRSTGSSSMAVCAHPNTGNTPTRVQPVRRWQARACLPCAASPWHALCDSIGRHDSVDKAVPISACFSLDPMTGPFRPGCSVCSYMSQHAPALGGGGAHGWHTQGATSLHASCRHKSCL